MLISFGAFAPGDQHRADDQVGVEHRPLDLVGVRRDGLAVALVDRVHLAQPGDVAVEQQHLGLHAERDRGGVLAGDAGADDDDLRRVHAGDAAHQHAAAAALAHQVVRADLRREPAGDLGHRREQRQRAVGQLHGLVGDAGRAGGEQRVGAGLVGGQVQVGEQHLVLAHAVVLLGDRLLDLEHQVAGGPHVVGGVEDLRAGGDVVLVRDRRADAGVALDEHLVAVADQLVHAGRGDRHPVLVVLDLAGDADLHGCLADGREKHCNR